MLVKIITLFLVAIAVLGMFGRLRWPGKAARRSKRSSEKPPRPGKCPDCGAFIIGDGPCPCQKG